jgi:phytoene desaturase
LKWLPEGLKEVISIHTLNAGVAPESTLALFATMPAVMATQKVLVPVGGVNEIPLTLEKLARHAGVEISLNEKVTAIGKNQVTTSKQVERCLAQALPSMQCWIKTYRRAPRLTP